VKFVLLMRSTWIQHIFCRAGTRRSADLNYARHPPITCQECFSNEIRYSSGHEIGGNAALARAVRNASRGVGSARHLAARASVCSAPRTSPKMESERLVVRRKERAAKKRGSTCVQHPAHSS